MRAILSIVILSLLVASDLMAQSFTDGFSDEYDDYAGSSDDWEAVWDGDGWTSTLNTSAVAPSTDEADGAFGGTPDAFDNAIVAGDEAWRHYSVEAVFRAADDDALGIVVRYTSPDSYYLVVLTRNEMPGTDGVYLVPQAQTRIYRVHEGVATQLGDSVNEAYDDDPGVTQTIRVEVGAPGIKVWVHVGGGPIDVLSDLIIEEEFTDDEPSAGKAGLYAFSMGEGEKGTYFSEFRVRPLDSDGDGKTNEEELDGGTDPHDADSDDDGIIDGDEFDWLGDADGDDLINALDWDSDNDGLADGLERGYTEPHDDTDLDAGHFTPDEDPDTTTNHLEADSDGGGATDGEEDRNGNGKYDLGKGETDPNEGWDDVIPSDGGPDADTDADTDSDSDSDSDSDTDSGATVDAGDADADGDADGDDEVEGDNWSTLRGGPDCGCRVRGRSIGSGAAALIRFFHLMFENN